eukprot:tig00021493_g21879.t1
MEPQDSSNPYVSVLQKRQRALRKKLEKLTSLSEKQAKGGSLNADQVEALNSKSKTDSLLEEVTAIIALLEPIAKEEKKKEVVVEKPAPVVEKPAEKPKEVPPPPPPVAPPKPESLVPEQLARLLRVLFAASVFDLASPSGRDARAFLLAENEAKRAQGQKVVIQSDAEFEALDQFSKLLRGYAREGEDLSSAIQKAVIHATKLIEKNDGNAAGSVSYKALLSYVDEIFGSTFISTHVPAAPAPVPIAAAHDAAVGGGEYAGAGEGDGSGQYMQYDDGQYMQADPAYQGEMYHEESYGVPYGNGHYDYGAEEYGATINFLQESTLEAHEYMGTEAGAAEAAAQGHPHHVHGHPSLFHGLHGPPPPVPPVPPPAGHAGPHGLPAPHPHGVPHGHGHGHGHPLAHPGHHPGAPVPPPPRARTPARRTPAPSSPRASPFPARRHPRAPRRCPPGPHRPAGPRGPARPGPPPSRPRPRPVQAPPAASPAPPAAPAATTVHVVAHVATAPSGSPSASPTGAAIPLTTLEGAAVSAPTNSPPPVSGDMRGGRGGGERGAAGAAGAAGAGAAAWTARAATARRGGAAGGGRGGRGGRGRGGAPSGAPYYEPRGRGGRGGRGGYGYRYDDSRPEISARDE